MRAPLDGIKVLDLSRVLAGPWCAMTLADLGAEVWKLETPKGGDETRKWAPPSVGGVSTYYLSVNRNKKAIALDMARPRGAELVRDLVRRADVVVENFMPKSLRRLGLDYDSLRALNPRIVHCSISGYGRDGPLADRPGYDFVMQAECGLMAITGTAEGEPLRFGVAITDLVSGMNATQAILAALYQRAVTGEGQSIDVALYRSGIQLLANIASGYLNTGEEPVRFGNAHPSIVPYQAFATADGMLALAVGTDEQYRRLCLEVLGRGDLAQAPDYASNRKRAQNRAALVAALGAIFATRTTAHWLARLAAADVPAGKVRKVSEAFLEQPDLAGAMVAEVPHPALGRVKVVGSPLRFSGSRVAEPSHPPLLGEHTAEVLARVLGLDPSEIARLQDEGVVLDAGLAAAATSKAASAAAGEVQEAQAGGAGP
jgi:crotonobetainyl-CoA:carnitine CoA-transferase CaiB-like acyl-CoA transferase